MRTRLAALTVLFSLVVLVASCGGGSSDSSSGSDGGSGSSGGGASTTAADSGGSSGSSGSSGGKVDCDAMNQAAQSLISVQLLAQLDTPENVAGVGNNTMGNLDIDQFLADMATLHALDSYSGPLGDPKPAIDAYEDAGTQAKALFEADPPTQEAIDAYMASIGSTGDFLGHQMAISGALEEAGC